MSRHDKIIAVREREQCGVSIAKGGTARRRDDKSAPSNARRRRRAAASTSSSSSSSQRRAQASRFPCSIPVERSQCRVTMARTDHLFLLLGLSQSLFENRAARPGAACRFGRNAFLARVRCVALTFEKEKFQREFRRSRRPLACTFDERILFFFLIRRKHTSGGSSRASLAPNDRTAETCVSGARPRDSFSRYRGHQSAAPIEPIPL